jgi:hypothetical protein
VIVASQAPESPLRGAGSSCGGSGRVQDSRDSLESCPNRAANGSLPDKSAASVQSNKPAAFPRCPMTKAEDSNEGTGETGANPATGGRATEITAKRFAPDLESKIATQKRINALEQERNHKKRTLHDAQDDIEQKKDTLIVEVESLLRQQAARQPLFAVRWRL